MTIQHRIAAIGGLHSIRTRLILLLTLVVTVVYALVTVVDVTQKTKEVDSELKGKAETMLGIQADALAIPLWNFDRDEIERQLNLFVAHPDIISATVIPNRNLDFEPISAQVEGRTIAIHEGIEELSQGVRTVPLSAAQPASADGVGNLEREIQLEDEPLGHIFVSYSREQTARIRSDLIAAQIRQFLIITTVITLTIALAVTSLVRPILEITKAMAMIAKGDLSLAIPATERHDEIGNMAQALKVFKANAEQLKQTLDKERELSGLQRQFVSMVSHEFRTPLAIIDGNAQRVLRRQDKLAPVRLKDSQMKIRLAVARLSELMESVLSSARLEEGKVALEPGECQVVDMLNELGNNYHELNSDREIVVDIEQLPNCIFADRNLLRQAFSNLLSNAIKYSSAGTRIWLAGYRNEQDDLVISVRDEGVGIPALELEKLFERFFRASTSTGIAGSGIGLHLVQHFIGLHGGGVEVESEVGIGTTFIVRLPFVDPAIGIAKRAA